MRSHIIASALALTISLFLVGCGGGGGGTTSSSPSSNNLVATAIVGTAPTSSCPNGGITVNGGIDLNGNGVLDNSEITSTQYVCNGTNGTNGTNGANGLSALALTTNESAGANCAAGGKKVSIGLDTNGNSILDIAEITASYYVCNGSPGSGITWLDVTGTTQQAVSNTGYMADNGSQVTITLPATASVGDLIQITGVGAGGWKIAQNAGQSIITQVLGTFWTQRASSRAWSSIASSSDGTKLVAAASNDQLYTSTDSGVTWSSRDSIRNWSSVASSADGTKLIAAARNDQLYTSTDSGVTWTPRDSIRDWISVASSADGTKLIAADYNIGLLYISNDSGVTWTPQGLLAGKWVSVASSADGTNLVAATTANTSGQLNTGQIYTSTDSGASWTLRGPIGTWQTVASSADGSKLVVGGQGNLVTSNDFGVTWTSRGSVGMWVASSSDGTILLATSGQLNISTDSGATWTLRDSSRAWSSVASSADGTRLIAAASNGSIYTSISKTASGIAGFISGDQYQSIDLQYIGNNTFLVRSQLGDLTVQ